MCRLSKRHSYDQREIGEKDGGDASTGHTIMGKAVSLQICWGRGTKKGSVKLHSRDDNHESIGKGGTSETRRQREEELILRGGSELNAATNSIGALISC